MYGSFHIEKIRHPFGNARQYLCCNGKFTLQTQHQASMQRKEAVASSSVLTLWPSPSPSNRSEQKCAKTSSTISL